MRLLIPLILLLQAATGGLSDSALRDSLNAKYSKQLLTVRNFPAGARVRFDGDGKLLEGMPGIFTLDGSMRVEVRGRQAFLAYNAKTKRLEESLTGEKMTLEFARKSGVPVEKNIDAALVPFETLTSVVPGYWAKFLTGNGQLEAVVDAKTGIAVPRASESQGLVPRGTKTPAPSYPKAIQNHGVTGRVTLRVIVDENGKPTVADLVEPVGFGLDQVAIDAVNQWEYEPARKDGKGVKVYFRVVVNFNSSQRN
jgi:TonB family protein